MTKRSPFRYFKTSPEITRIKRLRPYLDHGFLEADTDVVEQPFSQPVFGFGGFSRQASTIRA